MAIALVTAVAGYAISRGFWWRGESAGDARHVEGQQGPLEAGPGQALDPAKFGQAFSADATPDQVKEEAVRVSDELARASPNNADALRVKARLQFNLGEFDKAVETWRQCLELDPKAADAWYGIGFVAAQGGRHEQAVETLGRAMVLEPTDFRTPPLLADELMKLGRFNDAASLLEGHVRGPVAAPLALTTLGKAYLQLQRYEEARKTYQVAVEVATDKKAALYGLATACARLGQKEEAKRYMDQFAALAAGDVKERSQRLKDFGDAATTREILARVHFDAGRHYLKLGQSEKAEEMLRKAAVLVPQDAEPWRELLALYEQAGRDPEALDVCRQLRQLQPDNGDHWMNVGLLSARLGDFDEALSAAKRALEIDPNNAKYRQVYEMIEKGK